MSDQTLKVDSLAAGRGERVAGTVEVQVAGQAVGLPVFLINGAGDGPTVCITAGVHAAEYASIAAALEVGQSLQPEQLRGRLIVVPVVNVPGFGVRSIYVCPLDGKNPNRFFPGAAGGSPTEQLTAWVFDNAIRQANYFIDLHGGDLIEALTPFSIFYRSGNEEVDRVSQELAQVFGIPYIVRSETPGSAYSAASRAGIPAVLAEAGGQGIWHAEDVALHRNGVQNVLAHLRMIDAPVRQSPPWRMLDRFLWLRSNQAGFWYPAVEVNEAVAEGQELGQVRDFEGRVLQTANAPAAGKVLFLVTSLAINANDPLLAVGA